MALEEADGLARSHNDVYDRKSIRILDKIDDAYLERLKAMKLEDEDEDLAKEIDDHIEGVMKKPF